MQTEDNLEWNNHFTTGENMDSSSNVNHYRDFNKANTVANLRPYEGADSKVKNESQIDGTPTKWMEIGSGSNIRVSVSNGKSYCFSGDVGANQNVSLVDGKLVNFSKGPETPPIQLNASIISTTPSLTSKTAATSILSTFKAKEFAQKTFPTNSLGNTTLVNDQITCASRPQFESYGSSNQNKQDLNLNARTPAQSNQAVTPLKDSPCIATIEYTGNGTNLYSGDNFGSYRINYSARNNKINLSSLVGNLEYTFTSRGRYNLAVKEGKLALTKI